MCQNIKCFYLQNPGVVLQPPDCVQPDPAECPPPDLPVHLGPWTQLLVRRPDQLSGGQCVSTWGQEPGHDFQQSHRDYSTLLLLPQCPDKSQPSGQQNRTD